MYEALILDRDFHTVTLNAFITCMLDMAESIMTAPLVVAGSRTAAAANAD